MPVYVYSTGELRELSHSELVAPPSFKWNDIKKADEIAEPFYGAGSGQRARRRSSHNQQRPPRPPVMPKAQIPLAQRRELFGDNKNIATAGDENGDDDDTPPDDELAAKYLLPQKHAKTLEQQKDADGHYDADGNPVVPLKYAAALAASMHTESGTGGGSAVADEDDGDWISVTHQPKNRKKSFGSRNRGSFSRWRKTEI